MSQLPLQKRRLDPENFHTFTLRKFLIHILFSIISNMSRFRICTESLEHFNQLQSASHRDAWTTLLILIFTRVLRLEDTRVRVYYFVLSLLD